MINFILDCLVVLLFAYLSRVLWVISKKKRASQVVLLLRTISWFTLLHLILFPIIYVFLINSNTSSIEIDENIVTYERDVKLSEAKRIYNEIDLDSISKQQRKVINGVLAYEKLNLETIDWNDIDDDRLILLGSNIIKGYTRYRNKPIDQVHKVITIYNSIGEKVCEFKTCSSEEKLSNILVDYLDELNMERDEIEGEIETIKSDKFWSYRQILPYTLNILFTDNFNPKSRMANVVYFVHNILVVGFLLTFIVNLFQYYLLSNKQE